MISKHRNYFFGLVVAGLLVAAFCDISGLEALSQQTVFRNLAPEIRLAHELGIYQVAPGAVRSLRYQVTDQAFGQILQNTHRLLGLSQSADPAELRKAGILGKARSGSLITRQQALEALSRWVISLKSQGFVRLPNAANAVFPDYQCPPELQEGVNFLRATLVVRGYQNGAFTPQRRITLQESIMLIYRTYEQIALLRNAANANGKTYFVDLPLDHYLTQRVQFLETIGAFESVNLGPSFDGNRFTSLEVFTGMAGGILKRAFKGDRLQDLNALFAGSDPTRHLTRGQAVQTMELIIKMFGPKNPVNATVAYDDVPAESPLGVSAQSLATIGIRVGYANLRMAPQEPVTRFEAVSLLEAVMKRVNVFEPVQSTTLEKSLEVYPQKKDLEDFVARIRAKQARIRELLNRNPQPRRQ